MKRKWSSKRYKTKNEISKLYQSLKTACSNQTLKMKRKNTNSTNLKLRKATTAASLKSK
jgi:hypothetical protein